MAPVPVRHVPTLIAPDRPQVMAWAPGTHGNIWLAENGRAARLADGALSPVSLPSPRRDNYVIALAAAADGGVWLLCDDRVRKWKDGQWIEDRGEYPWTAPSPCCGLELRDGTLAIGTIRSGMSLLFGDGRPPVHLDRQDGLPQNWVRFLYEDREGNLWAGTGSAGLVSVHKSAFSVVPAPEAWRGCSVLAVAPGRDDALWIGTDGAGLYRYAAGDWTRLGETEGLGNPYIPAVAETPDGNVWAGNYWWGGPYRLEHGQFVRPGGVPETSSPVLALLPVADTGELLVGNREGLLRCHQDRSTWLIKSPQGTGDDVCALVRDAAGAIWCGFAQGGLARFADGKVSVGDRAAGLGSDAVLSLLADADGALWIGTADRGLIRFKDGTFAHLGVEQGMTDKVICYLLDDGLGHCWLSTHHGFQPIARQELNDCADGMIPVVSSQIYDRSDGLPIVEFLGGRQAAGCRTDDGRLWFASSKGLLSVDPGRIQTNPILPPVVLESLVVDGRTVSFVDTVVPGRLPPDHERLEFRFSALSCVAPGKVRFRHRLDGIEKTWGETGPQRVRRTAGSPPARTGSRRSAATTMACGTRKARRSRLPWRRSSGKRGGSSAPVRCSRSELSRCSCGTSASVGCSDAWSSSSASGPGSRGIFTTTSARP